MKKILFAALCAVSAVAATPAFAEDGGEGRFEVRGGVGWGSGESTAIAGIGGGYDWDLGTGAFGGVELSADKMLRGGGTVSLGTTARLGAKLGEGTKVYAVGGYAFQTCSSCADAWTAGAGIQHKFGDKLYIKAEYRHLFVREGFDDANVVMAGVGFAV